MRKKWKLYVWEDVLADWTSGMIVVVASSDAEAMKLVEKNVGRPSSDDLKVDGQLPTIIPLGEVKEPALWYVYGGG